MSFTKITIAFLSSMPWELVSPEQLNALKSSVLGNVSASESALGTSNARNFTCIVHLKKLPGRMKV
jgi:hypothetical protein